jgi:hypothetical protein
MKLDEIPLDRLLGRTVLAGNNRRVGRLEELRAGQDGDDYAVVAFVIGAAGLRARLNVGLRALVGLGARGKVARWDQIDITDPDRPRLTCSVEELGELQG